MNQERLILMARYPTPGRVKTRLADGIGARRAAQLYRSWLETFAREFAETPFEVEWRYTPSRSPFRRIVHNPRYRLRPQPDGSLGERMSAIFEESFAEGCRRVVMIGTDAPTMKLRVVRRAFRLLRQHDIVAQPTEDGGYALIGLSGRRDIFSRISWSTARVMAQTRQRARRLGASLAELPVTFDVDTVEDLKKLVGGQQKILAAVASRWLKLPA
jgi:rSAM/selenodomain-associated transferase 1